MKTYLIFLFILVTANFSQAQEKDWEKVKALKVAFITERLNLTTEEAQKFWPVYNKFDDTIDNIRKQIFEKRRGENPEDLSEQEAKLLISDMVQLENQKHEAFKTYMSDLQKVLSAKKIVMLKKAEDDFKRKMFNEYKKRKH